MGMFKAIDRKIINEHGYFALLAKGHIQATKNGYVLEHRMVMSDYLGRKLEPHEVVHHINGDKLDNRIENLELLDVATHGSRHKKKL